MSNRYTTTQGDMWDSISLRIYGTEKLMHALIEANHHYRHVAVFPANRELVIPEPPRGTRATSPPWRAG